MPEVMQDTRALSEFLGRAFTKQNIEHYETAMKKCKKVNMDGRDQFHYAQGIACKTFKAKAGEIILGKWHRESTLNILLSGKIRLAADGYQAVIEAPLIFVSPANTRKLGHAITDVIFSNVHRTDQVDPHSVETELICAQESDLKLPKPDLPTTGIAPVDKDTIKMLLNNAILSNERDPEILKLCEQVVNGQGTD